MYTLESRARAKSPRQSLVALSSGLRRNSEFFDGHSDGLWWWPIPWMCVCQCVIVCLCVFVCV